jgi:hypothetical protein
MDSNDMLWIVAISALPLINSGEVLRFCMSWMDVHRGAAVALAIIAIPLIIGWRKLHD